MRIVTVLLCAWILTGQQQVGATHVSCTYTGPTGEQRTLSTWPYCPLSPPWC